MKKQRNLINYVCYGLGKKKSLKTNYNYKFQFENFVFVGRYMLVGKLFDCRSCLIVPNS